MYDDSKARYTQSYAVPCIAAYISSGYSDGLKDFFRAWMLEIQAEEIDPVLTMKAVVLARYDLGMTAGKLGAQVGHAIHYLSRGSREAILEQWEDEASGSKIVVLGVSDQRELMEIMGKAESVGLGVFPIEDAGRTEVAPGSLTVAALGPFYEEILDSITGHLRPYKDPKSSMPKISSNLIQ